MPPELLGLEQALTGEELIVYTRNLATPQNYLSELFFPTRETSELTIDIIREGSRLPVMAQIGALGTEIKFGSREGMKGDTIEIPKIQRGRAMEEKLVRLLLQGNLRSAELEELRRTQLDDAAYAVDAIRARKEWIAMQAITTGTVSYQEADAPPITVDFGYTNDQKPVLSGTDLWSAVDTANPLEDIQGWVEAAADRGIMLSRALTSRRVLSFLLQNMSLRKQYFGDPSGSANPPQLNKAQLDTLFDSLELPQIVTYDTQARIENRAMTNGRLSFTNVRMAPQDRFALLPDGPLGHYLWAKTTEELLADIEGDAQGDGIYVFRDVEVNPLKVKTMGANLAFPSFGLNDSVVTATVI